MLVEQQVMIGESVVEPVKVAAPQHEKKPSPSFLIQAQSILYRTPVAVVAIVIGLITLTLHGYNVDVVPDVFSDEGLYLQVGISLAQGYGLTVNHMLFLWHPPIYMLLEAAYIRLAGLTNADPLTVLLAVRHVNIIFSGLTAILIMFFGRKLHSCRAGVTAAALFIMDPYVQRINRRNMLETVAMFCIILGLYLFYTKKRELTNGQCLGSGIAFGLALLTKEAVFPELCVIVAYTVCFNRRQIRDACNVLLIAIAIYLIYPISMFAMGQGDNYLAFKLFGFTRIVSLITGHKSAPPPGTYLPTANRLTFVHNLLSRVTPYITSYMLIGFAGIFTIVLFLYFRKVTAARYLVVWSIFSFGFGSVLTNISDQYAYFLIVPSTIIAGCVLIASIETILYAPLPKRVALRDGRLTAFLPVQYRTLGKAILASFLLVLVVNGYLWMHTDVMGVDNSYINTIRYVTTHLPAGTTIVVSDDVTVYLISPAYNIRLDRDEKLIASMHTCYFIMSSKDAEGGYDAMTPDFYAWVMQGTHPLIEQQGPSFGKMGLYKRIVAKGDKNESCNH